MNNETEQQKKTNIEEARARLAEKYQSAKIGGVGTMRRKHKAVHKPSMTDAKLEAVMKKFNTQPIPDIAEVNMFTTDAKVISFSKPTVHASFQTQTMIVIGNSTTKELKNCFAEILTQLGAKQLEHLKNTGIQASKAQEGTSENSTAKPNLNFEDVSEN